MDMIVNHRLWNKYSITGTWAIAIAFLAIVVLSIGWDAWSQSKAKRVHLKPQNVRPIARPARASYRIQDVVRANLFGNPNPVQVSQETPKTTLDLKLDGILWSSNGDMGRAIIVAGKKTAELYSVGETIKGANDKVEEIRNDEVILNRNGVRESLPLIKLNKSNNQSILTYVDESVVQDDERAHNKRILDNSHGNGNNRGGTPPERSRRPTNFSGLDQALEKIGEL